MPEMIVRRGAKGSRALGLCAVAFTVAVAAGCEPVSPAMMAPASPAASGRSPRLRRRTLRLSAEPEFNAQRENRAGKGDGKRKLCNGHYVVPRFSPLWCCPLWCLRAGSANGILPA